MKHCKHIIANCAIIVSSRVRVWELGMNEVTTLSSPLSVYPTEQEIPEKSQSPHLIMHLRTNVKFLKDFHLLEVMITFTQPCTHFTSVSLKKYPRILISFLNFASHFKSAFILQHESTHYVLPYVKLPKSRVKLQSARFQTTSSGEHSPGVVQRPLSSSRWGPQRQHPTSASRYNLQATAPASLK